MALVNRVVFVGEFSEKGSQCGGGCSGVGEFLAEMEVEPDPFIVIGPELLRHSGLFKPSVETGLQFRGAVGVCSWGTLGPA
jgi:hypothetical protein